MKKAVFFTLAFLFIANLNFAQDINELVNMSLEDILNLQVSTASKIEENLNDAPGIITVLTNQEINNFAAQNLGQILNKVISSIFISANVFSDNLIVMRGQSLTPYNNHILILMDGRPIRDPISGGLNNSVYTTFPIDAIDHIEIIRGPGSVLYGSCAYSGVINIITKTAKNEGFKSNVSLMYGTYNTFQQNYTGLYKKENLNMLFSISHLQDDGPLYDFTDYNLYNYAAHFDRKTLGVLFNLNYKNFSLKSFFGEFKPYGLSGSQNAWTFKDPHSSVNQTTIFTNLKYIHTFNEKLNTEFNFTFNKHIMDLEDDDFNYGLDYLFEFTSFYTPKQNTNIVFGGTFEKEDYYGDLLIDNNLNSYNFYFQADKYFKNKYKIVAGLQYNKLQDLDANLSPRIGLIARLNKNFGTKILYSTAFRKAYPLETSFSHPVFRGNLDINPELIGTFEAEIFYKNDKMQTSLTFFKSHLKDIIIRRWHVDESNQPFGGYLKYHNGGTFDFYGFEVENKYTITQNVLITAALSYQKNENEDNIEDAALHPNLMVKTGIIYNKNKLSIGIFNSYFGKPHSVKIVNPDVQIVNPEPEAFDLLSVKVTYNIIKNLAFSLNGDNLLNEYVRYPEYTSKGINTLIPLYKDRIFYATLNISF